MLEWPLEIPDLLSPCVHWQQASSNIVLDFHGDPFSAGLCIVSDGNHHMALAESINLLSAAIPEMGGVFYVTLPPPAIRPILANQCVILGNLKIPVYPDLMLSPANVMQAYSQSDVCVDVKPFVTHRGYAMLVAKTNPKHISSIDDLLREDVTLFLSNPHTESVSYLNYRQYLIDTARRVNRHDEMEAKLDQQVGLRYGECIHHREAPELLAQGHCDVAILYYHLALRFSRIFPQYFQILPLREGDKYVASSHPNDQVHIGLINHAVMSDRVNNRKMPSQWARQSMDFLLSDDVAEIYRSHGLDSI